MFAIEFVAVRGRSKPEVVKKLTSNVARLVDADKIAKVLLGEKLHEGHAPPDGYQIRANDGRVVFRFLER